jgi:hypothetical protein
MGRHKEQNEQLQHEEFSLDVNFRVPAIYIRKAVHYLFIIYLIIIYYLFIVEFLPEICYFT